MTKEIFFEELHVASFLLCVFSGTWGWVLFIIAAEGGNFQAIVASFILVILATMCVITMYRQDQKIERLEYQLREAQIKFSPPLVK